jgi:hypothetical protein
MDVIISLLPVLASTASVSQLPGCSAISDVSNLLRIGDEGLRYCSSILSIGTIADPVYSTVTAILTTTISEVTRTDTEPITEFVGLATAYVEDYLETTTTFTE